MCGQIDNPTRAALRLWLCVYLKVGPRAPHAGFEMHRAG